MAAYTIYRIHPETGEILFADSIPNPRAIAVDSSGTLVTTTYQSGFSAFSAVGQASKAWEDRNFNSIRALNRPLGVNLGGRQQGVIYASFSSTYQLTPQNNTLFANTASAAVSVTMLFPPTFSGWPLGSTTDWVVTIGDISGNASGNNISINSGESFEDPNTAGSFVTSATIHTNWQVVTWRWDYNTAKWKIIANTAGGGGGISGITIDNQGSAIGGNPHTTLNFTGAGVTASDAGGGVATITIPGGATGVPTGYILVGNANPSTGTLDSTHLQAIVDTSAGSTTVNAPDATTPAIQQLFRVTDDTATAATNPITVQSQASRSIEDPNNHGHYATSVLITVNSQSIDWQWTGSHYKIV